MAVSTINVNKADLNFAGAKDAESGAAPMPYELMGLLFFAYRDFVRDADALLETQGMGRAHHRVLYFVNRKPGMTVAELLDILRITKQSLARVLRQLVDSGHIEQHPGETDRRQRLLFPTQKGRVFFETLSRLQANRIEAALATMPEGSRRTISEFLANMIERSDRPVLEGLGLTRTLNS